MGLDMFLNKKTYVKNWGHTEKSRLTKVTAVRDGKSIINPEKVTYIIEEAGYWRKANAIHKWFIDNVQDGEDDCKEYYVSQEQMKELLKLVNAVLKASKLVKGKIQNGTRYENGKESPIMENGKYVKDPTIAEKLLPATEGFFFGSTNYDQYYIEDLKLTKKILEEALKDDRGEFYYQSSW